MKFKLDENFGTRTQQLFKDAGHQVKTVREEGLSGGTDQRLYEICGEENLCLVTLDLDFSNVMRFPPEKGKGIAVIRVPQNPSLKLLEQLIKQFLRALGKDSIENKLWIVEVGRIRIHQSELGE